MRFTVEVEGERFNMEVQRGPDGVRIECEEARIDVRVGNAGASVALEVEGTPVRIDLQDDTTAIVNGRRVHYFVSGFEPGAPVAAGGAQARIPVRAVMHGRLVKVLAEAGQPVRKGDPLFILEAMKMQNELACPADGFVSEVVAKAGDVVDVGRVLAWLERRKE